MHARVVRTEPGGGLWLGGLRWEEKGWWEEQALREVMRFRVYGSGTPVRLAFFDPATSSLGFNEQRDYEECARITGHITSGSVTWTPGEEVWVTAARYRSGLTVGPQNTPDEMPTLERARGSGAEISGAAIYGPVYAHWQAPSGEEERAQLERFNAARTAFDDGERIALLNRLDEYRERLEQARDRNMQLQEALENHLIGGFQLNEDCKVPTRETEQLRDGSYSRARFLLMGKVRGKQGQ